MVWSAIGNQCQSHFDVCGLHSVIKELWLFSHCAGRLQCLPLVSLTHSLSLSQSCQLHRWTSSQGSHTKWTMFTNKGSTYWFFLFIVVFVLIISTIRPLCCCALTQIHWSLRSRARWLIVNLNSRTPPPLSLSLSSVCKSTRLYKYKCETFVINAIDVFVSAEVDAVHGIGSWAQPIAS